MARRARRRSRPARRRLGQHFLSDPLSARRIVEAAEVGPGDLVLEIGPGRGALTGLLIERASRVVGIEVDPSLCSVLKRTFGDRGALTVLRANVLQVDLPGLVRKEGYGQAVAVGNLPYHITGAVIEQILDAREALRRGVVMVQREVAVRAVAHPGGKDYGILSIAVQLRTRPERVFDLPPEHFVPAPRVHSSVLKLEFADPPPVQVNDEGLFFGIVRQAFGQRRKMLKNALLGAVGGREEVLDGVLSEAGVDGHLRPEALSIQDYERICRAISACRSVTEASPTEGGVD